MQAEAFKDGLSSVAPASARQVTTGVVANSDVLTLRDVKTFAVGFSSYTLFTWLFDYPLYGAAIWHLGALWGGLIMVALSLLVDIGSIRFYDWSKRDWLAVEFIRSHTIYLGNNPLRRFVKFVLTKTPKVLQVMLLSLRFNAFIVTTLLRDSSSSFNGLSRADWGIFALSFLTGHVYWIMVIYGGIQGFEFLFS